MTTALIKLLIKLRRDAEDAAIRSAAVRRKVEKEAPKLIESLCETMTLREVAKRSGLSPTYVCRVRTGDADCSVGAFLKILELAESRG